MTITGNYFKRSGKQAEAASYDSSHLLIEGAQGVTCVGNNFQSGRDDGGKGVWSPTHGIVCKNLQNCVIANNVMHEGALQQLIIDLGEHGEGVVLKDNPGSLFEDSGVTHEAIIVGAIREPPPRFWCLDERRLAMAVRWFRCARSRTSVSRAAWF